MLCKKYMYISNNGFDLMEKDVKNVVSFKVKCVASKIKNEQNKWQFENVINESQIGKHDGRVYLGKLLLTKVKNKNIFCNLHV